MQQPYAAAMAVGVCRYSRRGKPIKFSSAEGEWVAVHSHCPGDEAPLLQGQFCVRPKKGILGTAGYRRIQDSGRDKKWPRPVHFKSPPFLHYQVIHQCATSRVASARRNDTARTGANSKPAAHWHAPHSQYSSQEKNRHSRGRPQLKGSMC